MNQQPKPPLPRQHQPMPGYTTRMRPKPDHGEESYRGSGKLAGKKAVITGADSGIGRAVAIAYAREGAEASIFAFIPEFALHSATASPKMKPKPSFELFAVSRPICSRRISTALSGRIPLRSAS